MIGWIGAIIAVLGAGASVYFALDTQVTWWEHSGQVERARNLDRWLRRVNPLRRRTK